MTKKLNILHLRVLSLFTGYSSQLFIREVARKLGISSRTALLALDDLERFGVLEAFPKGKLILYDLKRTPVLENYLCLAETYKRTIFLDKHPRINSLISNLDADIIIIFGSYAKGLEKSGSDIDLFIIGDYDKKVVEDFENTYNISVDIKKYNIGVLKSTDVLMREVIRNHVIISGTQRVVRQILSLKHQL